MSLIDTDPAAFRSLLSGYFSGAERIFNGRKTYLDEVFTEETIPNMAETWGKDRFYGKINTHGYAIIPRNQFLKPLKFPAETKTSLALNFVSDAWRDFSERLRQLVKDNIIYPDSPWAQPFCHRGFEDSTLSYDLYMRQQIFDTFTQVFVTNNADRIRDFETFLDVFSEFYEDVISRVGPLTRSGLVEGGFSSPFVTGLVLEIGNDSYTDDRMKINKYGDINFNVVANVAAQYGFLIDRNIPWRLVADLSSRAMQEYMIGVPIVGIEGDFKNTTAECDVPLRKNPAFTPDFYGYSQIPGFENIKRHVNGYIDPETNELTPGYPIYEDIREESHQQNIAEIIFDAAYEETWKTDLDILEPYLLAIYNSFVAAFPQYSITTRSLAQLFPADLPACGADGSASVIIKREPIDGNTIGTADARYRDRWGYALIYGLRSKERQKNYTPVQDLENLRDITNYYDFIDTETALRDTLRFVQQQFIGPLQREVLNLRTLSDIKGGE